MINTALVGFGWWGKNIIQKLINSNRFNLRLIVESDIQKHQNIKELGIVPLMNFDEMLKDTTIEAVILTTPNHLHDTQVFKCALNGKHVFCEKPLSLTSKCARSSVNVCKKNNVILGVGHERRFEPAIKFMKDLIDKEVLGTIMHAEMAFSHDKLISIPLDSWRQSSSKAPAAGMTQMGIHLTDLLIWMFGKVVSVQAIKTSRSLNWETGDSITVQLMFKKGMTATFQSILHTPFFLRSHIFGSSQWVEVRNSKHPDAQDGIANMDISISGEKIKRTEFKWEDTVLLNLLEFADAIRGKSTYPFSEFELIHNIEVLEAIINAANSKSTIHI